MLPSTFSLNQLFHKVDTAQLVEEFKQCLEYLQKMIWVLTIIQMKFVVSCFKFHTKKVSRILDNYVCWQFNRVNTVYTYVTQVISNKLNTLCNLLDLGCVLFLDLCLDSYFLSVPAVDDIVRITIIAYIENM